MNLRRMVNALLVAAALWLLLAAASGVVMVLGIMAFPAVGNFAPGIALSVLIAGVKYAAAAFPLVAVLLCATARDR